MPVRRDQTGAPAAGGTGPGADGAGGGRPNPNRAMDQDRAGDVRPADGRPAAGAGFEPQAPAPQADEGERKPAR